MQVFDAAAGGGGGGVCPGKRRESAASPGAESVSPRAAASPAWEGQGRGRAGGREGPSCNIYMAVCERLGLVRSAILSHGGLCVRVYTKFSTRNFN